MRMIDADKLYPDCMTKNGEIAISQSQLANAPTLTPPKGEWVELPNYRHKCSICNNSADTLANLTEQLSNFCPNCGAKMTQG